MAKEHIPLEMKLEHIQGYAKDRKTQLLLWEGEQVLVSTDVWC